MKAKKTTSIAISQDAYERMREKADRAGMKYCRFIEFAIDAFEPRVAAEFPRPARRRRTAGLS